MFTFLRFGFQVLYCLDLELLHVAQDALHGETPLCGHHTPSPTASTNARSNVLPAVGCCARVRADAIVWVAGGTLVHWYTTSKQSDVVLGPYPPGAIAWVAWRSFGSYVFGEEATASHILVKDESLAVSLMERLNDSTAPKASPAATHVNICDGRFTFTYRARCQARQ